MPFGWFLPKSETMLDFFKNLFGSTPDVDFKTLLQQGAIIVDVRTPAEYKEGHIPQSKNIPVTEISGRIAELKKYNKPVITCCRSGSRSGMAKTTLTAAGVEAYNGGPWNSLLQKLQ